MKTIKRKIENCKVIMNKNGGVKIPFEVGEIVIAEYTEQIESKKYKNGVNGPIEIKNNSIANGDGKVYTKKVVTKVTDKKLNGRTIKDFIVDVKDKLVMAFPCEDTRKDVG